MKTFMLTVAVVLVCGCSGPRLSEDARGIHTVDNTDGCSFVTTETFTGLPKTVHDYIRERVAKNGGNAYKVISANSHSAMFANDTQRITYEVYNCPNR